MGRTPRASCSAATAVRLRSRRLARTRPSPERARHPSCAFWAPVPASSGDLLHPGVHDRSRDPATAGCARACGVTAFVQLRDGSCTARMPRSRTSPTAPGRRTAAAGRAGAVLVQPPRLDDGRTTIVLNHDARVYRHHLRLDYDFDTVVAQVTQHPQDPTVWGLRNVQPHRGWSAPRPASVRGRTRTVGDADPGHHDRVHPGIGESGRIVA